MVRISLGLLSWKFTFRLPLFCNIFVYSADSFLWLQWLCCHHNATLLQISWIVIVLPQKHCHSIYCVIVFIQEMLEDHCVVQQKVTRVLREGSWPLLILSSVPVLFPSQPVMLYTPVTMENLPINNGSGQPFGLVLYETSICSGGLLHASVHDSAQVGPQQVSWWRGAYLCLRGCSHRFILPYANICLTNMLETQETQSRSNRLLLFVLI